MVPSVHALKLATFTHPVEAMEPEPEQGTAYQECARRMLRALNLGLEHIMRARDARRAAYEVAFAFGASMAVGGETMTSIATRFGVTRQAISKEVADFQQAAGLPPSTYQKNDGLVPKYRASRQQQLRNSN